MARPKITINSREFGRMLVDQVGPVQERIAEQVADRARSGAPVASGEYKDRIETVSDTWRRGGLAFTRARVVARAAHSIVVESKTGNLKRALGGA